MYTSKRKRIFPEAFVACVVTPEIKNVMLHFVHILSLFVHIVKDLYKKNKENG